MTMLKFILPVMLLVSINSFAQTNTFPPDGGAGIGTTSPTQPLDVVGNVLLRNMVNGKGAGASLLFSSYGPNNPGPRISGYLDFAEGNNSRSRLILSSYDLGYSNELTLMSGNVGVGTINPIGSLDVRGNTFIGTRDLAIGSVGSFVQIDQGAATGNTYSQIRAFNNGGNNTTDLILQNGAGNLGVGTVNPTQKVDVVGNILLRNMSNAPGAGSSISFSSYDSGNPGPKISGYLDFAEGGDSRSRLILSSYDHGYNNELTLMSGNVGIGTITPKERLSVNGKIRAMEVMVESGNWPDYVFSNGYELLTLKETEKYINENGHLPGVPTAAEVAKNGVELGDLNAKLLKKIEELTLHMIELEKNNEKQQREIDGLKSSKK